MDLPITAEKIFRALRDRNPEDDAKSRKVVPGIV
jgi:hypothetical protein